MKIATCITNPPLPSHPHLHPRSHRPVTPAEWFRIAIPYAFWMGMFYW